MSPFYRDNLSMTPAAAIATATTGTAAAPVATAAVAEGPRLLIPVLTPCAAMTAKGLALR
jgi:hypothetical protein